MPVRIPLAVSRPSDNPFSMTHSMIVMMITVKLISDLKLMITSFHRFFFSHGRCQGVKVEKINLIPTDLSSKLTLYDPLLGFRGSHP